MTCQSSNNQKEHLRFKARCSDATPDSQLPHPEQASPEGLLQESDIQPGMSHGFPSSPEMPRLHLGSS